jgi:SMI1 / KNR4 family (SUKH-1)
VEFENSSAPTSMEELTKIEEELQLKLPTALRDQYLLTNGGRPMPYVYEDDDLDTVVAAFLPISSMTGGRTAVDTYKHLVLSKQLVMRHFFPFAIDGGGDYFFVDCSTDEGMVYFFQGDAAYHQDALLPLELGIGDFWNRLKYE